MFKSPAATKAVVRRVSFSKPMEPKTRFFSSNPNELSDTIEILLQEKRARNNFNTFFEEIVAIAYKLSQYKSISTKQRRFLNTKCLD